MSASLSKGIKSSEQIKPSPSRLLFREKGRPVRVVGAARGKDGVEQRHPRFKTRKTSSFMTDGSLRG